MARRAYVATALAIVAAATVATLASFGCNGEGNSARSHRPVVIVGFDGMTWDLAAPLVRAGKMPNLKALLERGSGGYLYTEKPALSPVCWTSIATGKRKADHGITEFIDPITKVPFTSSQRATKAIWNIAGDYGLKTLCVGWWVTWPAEPIDGWMIAPYSTAGQNAFNWKGSVRKDLPHQTWPRALYDEIIPIVEDVRASGRLKEVAKGYFDLTPNAKLDDIEKNLLTQTLWSVEADEIYLRVVKHMQGKPDVKPDLTLTYFGCTDVVSHRFWRYMEPTAFRYPISAESIAEFKDAIAKSYAQADRILGDVLAGAPQDANVVVCSDHGFHADFVDVPDKDGLSGHHKDGPPGLIVMAGPDINPGVGSGAILEGTSNILNAGFIYDVTPTVLYLLGIPIGRDMPQYDGGPLTKQFVKKSLLEERPREDIRSHDEGFRKPERGPQVDAKVSEDANAALSELGYLSDIPQQGDERTKPEPKTESKPQARSGTSVGTIDGWTFMLFPVVRAEGGTSELVSFDLRGVCPHGNTLLTNAVKPGAVACKCVPPASVLALRDELLGTWRGRIGKPVDLR